MYLFKGGTKYTTGNQMQIFSILDHTGDVQSEWVSFWGQNSAHGCDFLLKNLRKGHHSNV